MTQLSEASIDSYSDERFFSCRRAYIEMSLGLEDIFHVYPCRALVDTSWFLMVVVKRIPAYTDLGKNPCTGCILHTINNSHNFLPTSGKLMRPDISL